MISKKATLAFSIGIIFFINANAQNSVRDFLGKYLVEIHEFDSAKYQQNKIRGKIETTTNYYADSLGSYEIGDIKLFLYKFGSYSDHVRPHFALIRASDYKENCVIDCEGIADDSHKILSFLKKYSGPFKNTENVKIRIMRKFVKDYPEFY